MKMRIIIAGVALAAVAAISNLYAQTGFHPAGTVFGNNSASSQALPSPSTSPRLGRVGSRGVLLLCGETSGCVTVQPQAAAGTFNWNLPTGAGSAGQPLLSGGGGAAAMTFGTLGTAAGGTGLATTGTAGQAVISGGGTNAMTVGLLGSAGGGTGANNTATANRYLKGNGTNFVTSSGSASGVGACSAGEFASTLNSDAAPTCSPAVTAASTFGTDNTALRADGTGRGSQSSALVIADTTGAISRSGNGGIPVQGTNTNDDACAGCVGEYVVASIAAGSGVSLSTGNPSNITSISLTAGDWDVQGVAGFDVTATTDFTQLIGQITVVSGTVGAMTDTNPRVQLVRTAGPIGTNADPYLGIPRARISVASTTSVFLVGQATFSASTVSAFGFISARRVR